MGSAITVRRRFQFSLKALLMAIAVVGLLFAGWQALDSRIEADEVQRIDAPIIIRARYVRLFGPRKLRLYLGVNENSERRAVDKYGRGFSTRVDRRWLCLYNIEHEFEPSDKACELGVTFLQGQDVPNMELVKLKFIKVQ